MINTTDSYSLTDSYFKSEADKLVFALLYTDAKTRMILLEAHEGLYYNKEEALRWYLRISSIIDPEVSKVEGAEDAMKKLNEIYYRMIK